MGARELTHIPSLPDRVLSVIGDAYFGILGTYVVFLVR